MMNQLTFKTDSLFSSVTYDTDADRWCFSFADKIYISAEGFWRLLKVNKILFVSLDNGQQFGQAEPLDLVEKITRQLKGKNLNEIKISKDTADLTLTISDSIRIEIYIASSGYETYEFSIQDKRYIGLGSGEIGVVEGSNNPKIFTTRQL